MRTYNKSNLQFKTFALFFILSSLISFYSWANDTIRIMPVGNSITAGEHYKLPALEKRTGYRKALYEMLIKEGYNVDFVGSQMHGIRSKTDPNWYDWNCEAYPGWRIPNIAARLQLALEEYKPNILLVHVGTNGDDWEEKPEQVEDMLDSINSFSIRENHPITVFLCLIINRYKDEDPTPTSKFNLEVTKRINVRTDDKIHIILVDLENDAGLDYSDNLPDKITKPPYKGGDMIGRRCPGIEYDKYHPNHKGNTKIARKLYEELIKVLKLPIESTVIPKQKTE